MSKQPKWVDTIPLHGPAKPLRKPYVPPAADDPGIGQGRNEHHNPQRDRDIVLTLLLAIAPYIVAGLLVFEVASHVWGGK